MATLITIRLTRAEVQQMLSYTNAVERDGWYYAPKKDFERRHASIKEILERVLIPREGGNHEG